MLRVVLVLALLAAYISFVFDVIGAPAMAVRSLPKMVWLLVVVVVPILGGLLWLVFGRPRLAGGRWGRQPVAPDDDPRFLRELDEQAWRERMRRRRDGDVGEGPDQAS